MIITAKGNYQKKMAEKFNDTLTSQKTYWSLLKNFLDKSKIPNILLLIGNGSVFSDFIAKANLFNDFFASQYSPPCGKFE